MLDTLQVELLSLHVDDLNGVVIGVEEELELLLNASQFVKPLSNEG